MKLITIILAASLTPGTLAQSPQVVQAVKPTAQELTWQKIPWVLDLDQAVKTARADNRPLFLWATGDDPLERC